MQIDLVARPRKSHWTRRQVTGVGVTLLFLFATLTSLFFFLWIPPLETILVWHRLTLTGQAFATQQPKLVYATSLDLHVELATVNQTSNVSSWTDNQTSSVVSWTLIGRTIFRDNSSQEEWRQYVHIQWNASRHEWVATRLAGFQLPGLGQDRFRLVTCENLDKLEMPEFLVSPQWDAAAWLERLPSLAISLVLRLSSQSAHLVPTLVADNSHEAVAWELRHELESVLKQQNVTWRDCRQTPILSFPLGMQQAANSTGKVNGEFKKKTRTELAGFVEGCRPERLGNGQCDEECNKSDYDWDDGDCCVQTRKTESSFPYNCRAGPVVLLLHGASWNRVNSNNLSRQFSDIDPKVVDQVLKGNLWGILPRFLHDYTSRLIFNSHDTYRFGWHDPNLQRAYYDKAKQVLNHPRGGLVVAHSLASMILAGACVDQGLCDVQWYSIAGALRGAQIVDLAYPLQGLTIELNNTGVQSMRPSFRNLENGFLSQVVHQRKLLRGAICGISPYGTGGWVGVDFSALTTLMTRAHPWTILTDGIVTLDECTTVGDSVLYGDFQQSVYHPWSIVYANHQDLAGAILGLSLLSPRASEPIAEYLRFQIAPSTRTN